MTKKFAINFDEMVKKIKDQEKTFKKETDDTVFVPKYKEDGTHVSIIRFLPSNDTDVPFVKKFNHGFQGPGGWFIEECPTSIGEKCPVCEANSILWKEGNESLAKERKKRLNYWINILVVKDPQTPENEGKVFKYRFGKKIYDKIMEKINPTDGLTEPVMVFDWYEGANFKLSIKQIKIANQKPQPNYDSSTFAEKTSVGSDTKIEEIRKLIHPLDPLISKNVFKDYEDLSEKFDKVISGKKTFNPKPKASEAEVPVQEDSRLDTVPLFSDPEETASDDDFFAKLKTRK